MYATILSVLVIVGQGRVEPERWVKYEEVVVAETVWTNALADGDMNNNGNWTNQTPDVTHTPGIFNGTTQTPPTTNLDRSAGTAFQLLVTKAYRGGLGSSGSPVKFNATGSGLGAYIGGSGDYYLEIVAGSNADVIVDAPSVVVLDGEVFGLVLRGANVTVAATCDMGDECVVLGSQSLLTVIQKDAAEGEPTRLRVRGGTVAWARDWTDAGAASIDIAAGTMNITGLIRTEVDVTVSGGVINYDPATDPSGEHPNLCVVGGGIFDMQASPYSLGANGRVIYGGGGLILGSISQSVPSFADYDLDDPIPGI